MLSNIRTALVNLYQSGGFALPIVDENRDDDEPTEFVRFTFVPADNTAASLGEGGIDRHVGFAQFDITLATGGGSAIANTKADELLTLFKRGKKETHNNTVVKITKSNSTKGHTSGNKYIVPVTVYWQTDIPR